MSAQKKPGRPRKHDYTGEKKNVTIRLTDGEREIITNKFENIQQFVQKALKKIRSL